MQEQSSWERQTFMNWRLRDSQCHLWVARPSTPTTLREPPGGSSGGTGAEIASSFAVFGTGKYGVMAR